MTDSTQTTEKKGKVLSGVVVSTKMQDSATVRVEQYKKHPKYKKFIKQIKNYRFQQGYKPLTSKLPQRAELDLKSNTKTSPRDHIEISHAR